MTGLVTGASGFRWGTLPVHADALDGPGWGPPAHIRDFVLGKPGEGARMCYPGERPPGSFVVLNERVLPVRPASSASGWVIHDGSFDQDLDAWLTSRGEVPLAERFACIGYGSNLNPIQIWGADNTEPRVRGFAEGRAVVVLRGVTVGLASVFCNSHRSDGQYPAGLAAADPARIEQHGVVLLDDEQRRRLDRKEGQGGTYDRSLISGLPAPIGFVLENGTVLQDDLPVYLQTGLRSLAVWSGGLVPLADIDEERFTDQRGRDDTDAHGLAASPCASLPTLNAHPLPVFVYGTLRPGQSRWSAIEHLVDHHEPAALRGHRFDTGHGFPGLLLDHPVANLVDGDLLHLAHSTYRVAMETMDLIEGHPSLYARHLVRVDDGRVAWTYLWNGPA